MIDQANTSTPSGNAVFDPTTAHGREPIPPAASWMPWAAGTRPNTTREEAAFLKRLGDMANSRRGEHTRSDITAVLNALRCGIFLDDLLVRAPGLQVERLYSAYLALDQLRQHSEAAWSSIASTPTVDAVLEFGPEAGKLVPALVSHLYWVIDAAPDSLREVVGQMAGDVYATSRCVRSIEDALQTSAGDPSRRASLGRLLYDPTGRGATSRPDFVAGRLGTLVPTAVAALLGERVDVTGPRAEGG